MAAYINNFLSDMLSVMSRLKTNKDPFFTVHHPHLSHISISIQYLLVHKCYSYILTQAIHKHWNLFIWNNWKHKHQYHHVGLNSIFNQHHVDDKRDWFLPRHHYSIQNLGENFFHYNNKTCSHKKVHLPTYPEHFPRSYEWVRFLFIISSAQTTCISPLT